MSIRWFDQKIWTQRREQKSEQQKKFRELYGIAEPEYKEKPAESRPPETWTFKDISGEFNMTFYTDPAAWTTLGSWTTSSTTITTPTPTPGLVCWSDPAPVIEQEDIPILAQRYAGLRVNPYNNFEMEFSPLIASHVAFGVDEDAVCRLDRPSWHAEYPRPRHSAPAWDCTCGFYAVPADKLPKHDQGLTGRIILQVELSGTVIIHDEGYRAEHQKVLEVIVRDCHCGEPATLLSMGKTSNKLQGVYCDEHGLDIGTVAEEWLREAMPYLDQRVIQKLDVAGETVYPIFITDASKMLGIPFTRYGA